ncbi:MAG: F0F1 ATP synthase subunit B [Desulfovibrio sp.]|jgi:F-type H+-transporting ATPase subunit b|nr:F0F1 ATP synthase subunit B [Desulfovibrio sp.]
MGKHSKRESGRNLLPIAAAAAVAVLGALGVGDALAGDGHGEPRWGDFGWRVLNFVIFVGILWYFVGGLAVKYFRGRKQGIRETLDNLEERRRSASEHLSIVEKRIAGLNQECDAILQESRQQAQALKDGIIADAERQAAQIIAQAKSAAESEGRAVLAEVRGIVADEIVVAAEKILSARLDNAAHEKLIDNSLDKVVLQ